MRRTLLRAALLAALTLALAAPAAAKDTDIYRPTVKPNVMIMFDNSSSMDFGVYEYTEDYGKFYDYLSERTCGGGYEIWDRVTGTGPGPTNYFYGSAKSWSRNEILMLAGDIGYVKGPDGKSYTGDPGDPTKVWQLGTMSHIGWEVNQDGTDTIPTDAEGYVLFNGVRLPNNQSIKAHDWLQNADGSLVDRGLAGRLKAPGYYFTGYFLDLYGNLTTNPANGQLKNGRLVAVLFVPGNWLSMQCVYNLYVVAGCPDGGQPAWKVRTDTTSAFWQMTPYPLTSPSYPGNYPKNYSNVWTITQPGASIIKVHFKDFETYDSGDKVRLYDRNNKLVATYFGAKGGFWSAEVSGDKAKIEFVTDAANQGHGWSIDSYAYNQGGGGYQLQRRIDVARSAILNVIDATMGKINWGLASFNYGGGDMGNGGAVQSPLNPTFSDDQVRANMVLHLNALVPGYGTPLCESAQDIYNYFHLHTNILRECTRNYVIYLSDGYPSVDDDINRLSTGVVLQNVPPDGFTQDPYQYPSPPPDLFDDATTYAYWHSVYGGALLADPASAYDNVTSHCIGFTLDAGLLADGAADGGGMYYVAFNHQQLVSAFWSLGLLIIKSAGYTAPVVSVDSANRTQSGDEVYMAFFKPKTQGMGYWGGNLKRYGLDLRLKGDCIPPREEREWIIVDYPGGAAPDATNCEGDFKESSISWWDHDGQPDGDDVQKGGVGELMYEAVSLTNLNPWSRPIYTYLDNAFVPFVPSSPQLTASALGVATDLERAKIINFTHGFTYDADPATFKPVEKRAWPLGDIIHSEPVIIDYCPPETPHGCTTTIARLLAVGANDGMLHIFDAETGEERWAFIPPDLLPKLRNFDPAAGINQQDLVDGPMGIYEYETAGIWQKVLIISERRGGRAYYAINVTSPDPGQWMMQWTNVGGSPGAGIVGGITPGFEELGQSWSRPQMAKLRLAADGSSRPVLIFGGGYDPTEDEESPGTTRTMGCAVYVVDLETGELIYSFSRNDNPTLKCVPADVTIVNDMSAHLDYFYFVDTTANIWRTTYTMGAPFPWETHQVFASNPGSTAASGWGGTGTGSFDSKDVGRKMFYPPDVSLGNTFTDYPVLYVGTGDREHPLEQTVHNRIYCIIDSIPAGPSYDGSGPLNELYLVNVTGDELDSSGLTQSERDRIQALLRNAKGWYVKLDEISTGNHLGEKVLAQATVFYRIAYFTTFTPIDVLDTCNPLGEAKVYALEYSIGTAALDYSHDNCQDSSDRFRVIGESIASRVKIIIRSGTAAGLISVGGKVTGAGLEGSSRVPQPGSAVETILWRELGPADIARGKPYGVY